jgi:peptidoglycan/LPS O-acetylase OafA/YrhL
VSRGTDGERRRAVVAAHLELPFAKGGGVGVDIFFVLSGFLITSLLLEEFAESGTISLRRFYIRRARRLLPALILVSAISTVAFLVVRPYKTPATIAGIGATLVYVSSWLRAFHVSDLGWFGHSWSLSVEEHFYVVWPLAVLLICRKRPDRVGTWVGGALVLAVLYHLAFVLAGASPERLINSPDLRAEQLLAGCALAALVRSRVGARRSGTSQTVALAFTTLAVLDLARVIAFPNAFGPAWYRNASTIIALESAIIIGYLVQHPASRLSTALSHPIPVWIGRRSYAIYLWHLPLLGLLSLRGQPESLRVAGRVLAALPQPQIFPRARRGGGPAGCRIGRCHGRERLAVR